MTVTAHFLNVGHGDCGCLVAVSEADATKLVVAVLVGALIIGAGWYYAESRGEIDYPATTATSPTGPRAVEPSKPSEVVLEVDGSSSRADLTMQVGAWQSQRADVRVPLKRSGGDRGLLFRPERGDFLYISAQRQDDNSGTIRCRIKVDGVVIVENESSGPYTIATCSGTM